MLEWFKKKTENLVTNDNCRIRETWWQRLSDGLKLTGQRLLGKITQAFAGKKQLDAAEQRQLEELLLAADVGVATTKWMLDELKRRLSEHDGEVLAELKQIFVELLKPCEKEFINAETPAVIMFVGVNGVGKTTTLGKIAYYLQKQGKKVLLAAGDTFRAAAIEQLQIWGERNQIKVIAQQSGADSAAVLYDALSSAKARKVDLLLADTAGRLHTQNNLMEELKKVKRVLQRLDNKAPQEIWLVLDATLGQNTLRQVSEFNEALGLTGLCLTKLDGSAKGGTIFALAHEWKLPLYFLGVGENIDDLKPFKAEEFVEALFAAK